MNRYFSCFLVILFFFLINIIPISANSSINGKSSLLNDSNSLKSDTNTLLDEKNSLVDDKGLLLSEDNSLIEESSSLLDSSESRIGVYENIVEKSLVDIEENTIEPLEEIIVRDIYINNYGRFLESVVTVDPIAKSKFVTYFTDWQWSGQSKDFFTYAADRGEYEKKVVLCYDNAIKKFGVGTAIVTTTWIVSFIVPGGTIIHASILVIAKATTVGALSGAAFDGVFSASKAIYQGKSTEEIVYETINGVAGGYVFGAIAGIAEGVVHVAILFKNAKTIADGTYIIFGKKLYDKSGKLIRDLSEFSDDAIKALMTFLEHGDNITTAIERLAINYEELNKLRLALERGEISTAMFWEEVAKKGWSKEICEEVLKERVDFGRYLRNLIGEPPSGMIDPHAHHILPKTGKGPVQQALVEKGQKILRSYGIDPVLGPENLCWAPNRVVGQHSEEAIREIVDGLKILQEGEATKEEIIDFLKVMGQKAAMRY